MPPTADDAAVFTQVFEEHRNAVHGYLLGRVADAELARDLLQETFLRVWRRLWQVRTLPAERQRAWILTVARNLVTDAYRAHATAEATHDAIRRQVSPPAAGADDPAVRAELRGRLAELGEAIRHLPEEHRVVLTMATVGGLTSRQIGEALGEPAGTVRYKLGQARKQLAAALDLKE